MPLYTDKDSVIEVEEGTRIIKGSNVLITTLDKIVNWGRSNSLWPLTFGLACCAIEMMAAGASRFDLDRYGVLFRGPPRQADLIRIAGTFTSTMAPIVKRIYDQMPEPKYVIAMGSCACTGGVFNTYSTVQGVDQFLPVDVYVPGCPPRPEALFYGIMKLKEKIMRERERWGSWR